VTEEQFDVFRRTIDTADDWQGKNDRVMLLLCRIVLAGFWSVLEELRRRR